jgi:hypothetical protein
MEARPFSCDKYQHSLPRLLPQKNQTIVTMQRKRNNKLLLAISSALLVFNSHAAHHHEVYRVVEEAIPEGSLRGQRKRNEGLATEAAPPRRLRNGAAKNQRRAQTMIEDLNQRVDKIAIDTFYNPEPEPNRSAVSTKTLRLNKIATELFFDEELLGDMITNTIRMSLVSEL